MPHRAKYGNPRRRASLRIYAQDRRRKLPILEELLQVPGALCLLSEVSSGFGVLGRLNGVDEHGRIHLSPAALGGWDLLRTYDLGPRQAMHPPVHELLVKCVHDRRARRAIWQARHESVPNLYLTLSFRWSWTRHCLLVHSIPPEIVAIVLDFNSKPKIDRCEKAKSRQIPHL